MELADLDLNKQYSYADYLVWQFVERVELLKGKLCKMSPAPSLKHQNASSYLHGTTWHYLRNKSCKVFHAPFDVRLPQRGTDDQDIYTVVQPDICVVCDLNKLDSRGCLGAPDWVIEIVSPGNSRREKQEKFEVYEAAGVKEYWLVDYVDKSVLAYVLNSEDKFIGLQPQTSAVAPTLFPDLAFDLEEAFAEV